MTERRIVHLIRHPSGAVDATARGVTPQAARSWKEAGCELFAFEVELPFQVAADLIQTSKEVQVAEE